MLKFKKPNYDAKKNLKMSKVKKELKDALIKRDDIRYGTCRECGLSNKDHDVSTKDRVAFVCSGCGRLWLENSVSNESVYN